MFYEPIGGFKILPSPFNTQIAIGSIGSRRKKVSLKVLLILIGTEVARIEVGFVAVENKKWYAVRNCIWHSEVTIIFFFHILRLTAET